MLERGAEPQPLSAEVRAYVDAFADAEQPTHGHRAATWAAIEADLARERRRQWVWLATGGMLVAAALVLAMGGLRGSVLERAPAEPSVQVPWEGGGVHDGGAVDVRRAEGDAPPTERASPSGAEPMLPAETGPMPASVEAEPVADGPVPAPSPGARRRAAGKAVGGDVTPAPAPAEASALSEELALFRRAKLAERDGNPARALVLLDAHRERFPGGALQREGTVLRAEALCALGRAEEALALRDRFLEQHGASPLATRMRSVCR
jgi:hypothetical protein